MLAYERKIPITMSTQHPDNATLPSWCSGSIIEGDVDIYEAFFAYSQLDCDEVMWDSEGKDVDTRVVRKLLEKHPDFFSEHQLGKDVFLTYRVPNPKIEGAERKVFVETLYNIAVACDVATEFYRSEVTPIFEVILPFTTNAKELIWLHNYYKRAIATIDEIALDDEVCIKDWIGCLKPKSIEVIPLIEDYEGILIADKIVEPFIRNVKPRYLRVFIARSDPALNYGLSCAVLLSKIAFSKMKSLENRLNVDIHLILGVGSLPFRGHLSPENIEGFLKEYKGLSTVTIQSALKYDYPLEQTKECIKTLSVTLPNGEPQIIEASEEEKIISVLRKSRQIYEETIEELAPLINSIASYVPPRRARKLHIGLFGYSRRVKGVTLPRAIPFVAALYSLGIPPKLLGCRIYTHLRDDEWEVVKKYYVNLEHDLRTAGGYLSWRNIDMIKDYSELISKKAGMRKETLENSLKKIIEDIKTIENIFGINLGPKTLSQRKHENFVNNFLISYIENDALGASSSLLEAAKIRKSLG